MPTLGSEYQRATTLAMVDDAIDFNVPIDDQHPFFTDFSDVRGEFENRMIYNALKVDPDSFAYLRADGNPNKSTVFIAGMRGSGKTSELAKMAHKLHNKDCFFCVTCNLDDGLDINDMEYMDVLIFQITRLLEELQERNVPMSEAVIDRLQTWFSERVKEVNHAIKAEAGMELQAGVKTPGLLSFLNLTLGVKAGLTGTRERAEKIRTVFKNNFGAFASVANTFFEDVNLTLRNKGIAKELLFVIDGLEKVATKDIRRQLIENEISRLQKIKANTIFTLPLELMNLRQKLTQFSTFTTFPFVKVKDQAGNPIVPAVERFRSFVERRIAHELFDAQSTIDLAIEFGGGSPRELLRILQYANYAADLSLGKITRSSVEKALRQLADETVQYVTVDDLQRLKILKEKNANGEQIAYDDKWQDLFEKVILMEYGAGSPKRINPIVSISKLYLDYVFEGLGTDLGSGIDNRPLQTPFGRTVPFDKTHSPETTGLHFKSIQIEGVKCIKAPVVVDFLGKTDQPSKWNVLIGENGVGKTTILRALVSMVNTIVIKKTLFPNGDFSNFPNGIPRALELDGEDSAKIEATFAASNKRNLIKDQIIDFAFEGGISTRNRFLGLDQMEALIVIAYGASRHMQPIGLANDILANISESLFSDTATLSNAEEFFLQVEYSHLFSKSEASSKLLDAVKELVKGVLPGVLDIRSSGVKNSAARRAEVLTEYGWVPIPQLSLGYKTMIAWIIDFAAKLFFLFPDSPNPLAEPAICIVDEIDLHMHPRWQRDIVDFLLRTFPNTQFIVTAHSPLIVQASADANIILLKREGDHIVVDNDPEIVANWRIDQLLTSDLFGLDSSRRADTSQKIARRKELLLMDNRTAEQEFELQALNAALADLPMYDSLLEKKAQTALDKILEVLQAKPGK